MVIDFGLFIFYLDDVPFKFVMIYLIGVMLFAGIIAMLGALENRRLDNPVWKRKMLYGLIKIMLSVGCLFYINSTAVISYVYVISLLHSAIYNIYIAFKKSAIIYIR